MFVLKSVLILYTFLFSALAFAQVDANSADSILNHMAEDIAAGKLVALVAGIILLVVFLFRKFFGEKIGLGSGAYPWLAIALGVLSGVGVDIVNGASPGQAAQVALLSGPAAMSVWSSLFKLIQKK